LYVSKNGKFFLAGTGGANSKYAFSLGNNHRGGVSDIELLNESEAKNWLETHQRHMIEDIEDIFQRFFPESVQEG